MTLDTTTRQLIDILHRGGAYSYWWTIEGRQSFWWEVGKPTALPGGRRNVYVGVHPTSAIPDTNPRGQRKPPRELRAQLAIIAALNCLYTEYDAKDFGGDKSEARAAADAIEPRPSVLVDSGGGYHLYWLFDQPWHINTEEERQHAKRLQAAWVAYAGGDKSVKDLARVLRVPGTFNYKYTPARKVSYVYADFSRRYTPDTLEGICAHLMTEGRANAATTQREATPEDRDRRYAQSALDKEVANVLRAQSGQKHDAIRNAAIKLGTLAARGLLTDDEILNEITRAADIHRDDVADTYRTALDGLAYGKARPREADTLPSSKPHSEHSGNSGDKKSAIQAPVPWGAILPFHRLDLPLFPLDILPTWIREYCEAVTETMQTPPDLAGMLALSILSTVCAKRVMVRAWAGWNEPVNVFTAVSLPPGSRKSPVFRAMMEPLHTYETEEANRVRDAIMTAEAQRDILKQRLEEAKRQAAKGKTEDERKRAYETIDDLHQEIKELDVPTMPKLIVDDITPETVASILVEQGGRLAVLSSEGDIFAIMAGRYSSGSPNIGVYKKGHAGDPLRVDRRNRSEFVRAPALTMGITTQPEVLRSFGQNNVFRSEGLLARFLYALPRSTVGSRATETAPIPDAVRRTYFRTILFLLKHLQNMHSEHSGNSGEQDQAPRVEGSEYSVIDHYIDDSIDILIYINISIEAKELFQSFRSWLEPQLAPYGELSHIADWAAKLDGAILRVAGLLHMAEHATHNSQYTHNPLDADTMARAIAFANYLIAHASAAYAEIGADPAIESAKLVIRWLDKSGVQTFTKRDCYQAVKGTFKRAAELDPVLELLCDHGYLRELPSAERDGPGRKPSPTYEVNPAFLDAHNSHNPQNADFTRFTIEYTPAVYANGHTPAGYREVAGYEELPPPDNSTHPFSDDYEEL